MIVRHVYSACVVVTTPDLTLCCDPWFTPGAYDGSWYQYPALGEDPVELIGPVDAIWVSHLHPDHYDPVFLRRYFARWPGTRLLIGNAAHLHKMMLRDGLEPDVIGDCRAGATHLRVVRNANMVDSALAVAHDNQSVLNLNDNPVDPVQVAALLEACPSHRPTCALLPYSGAGPYPQCYEFATEAERTAAERAKERKMLGLYFEYVARLQPTVAIPFAGAYVLGGRLAELNEHRGVSDATVAADAVPGSVVLADGGHANIDLTTGTPSAVRSSPYDPAAIAAHVAALNVGPYPYQLGSLPSWPEIRQLVALAEAHALASVPTRPTIWIRPAGARVLFAVGRGFGPLPDLDVTVDPRYLAGLLSGRWHWNNAEIGSHLRCRRQPDIYRPEVHHFLWALHA